MAEIVAASDSTQRSASTFRISGCSTSVLPKAERWPAWWIASTTPGRIPAALPSAQSSRVWLTISMIVRTPAPSSPTSRAQAPSNSTSLDAFERLPSLSLSRRRRKLLRSPSGVQRGNRKHERPRSAWARIRKASHIGIEKNHLWPVIAYSPPGPAAVQRPGDGGVGAHVGAALLLGHPHAGERAGLLGGRHVARVVARRRGCAAPTRRRARAAGGAPGPPSRSPRAGSRSRPRPRSCRGTRRRARRARPGRGSRQGSEWSWCSTARPSSSCHAGWNSTSLMRFPKRSWVFSFGGFSFASTALRRIVGAAGERADRPQPILGPLGRPRARTASTSGRSVSKTL